MKITTRLSFSVVTTPLLLLVVALGVAAQRNPTMAEQQRDLDKESLFAKFVEHKRIPQSNEQRLAYEAGKEYLRLFGTDIDPNVKEVRRFVSEYENVRRQYAIDTAFTSKDYAKTFELGRALLQKAPDDFYVLGTLSQAGFESSLTGNASLNAETILYTKKALQLIDTGAITKGDPFTTMEVARGFLNFALGSLLRDQSPPEAAAAFLKAVQADSPYRNDPIAYHSLGATTLKGEFKELSAEYNEKYGGKEPSADQKAMWDRIILLEDRIVTAYARAIALSTSPQQQEAKAKVLGQLTAVYKSFHGGSDAGLAELLAGALAKPLP